MADKKQTMLYGLLTSIASKITYDNTASGLEADNVQDALDEVSGTLDEVVDEIDDLKYPKFKGLYNGSKPTIGTEYSFEHSMPPRPSTPSIMVKIALAIGGGADWAYAEALIWDNSGATYKVLYPTGYVEILLNTQGEKFKVVSNTTGKDFRYLYFENYIILE